jgi:hypothetical protein|tara:strand:+ start:16395 stop:18137 length:1743 start_codon:yes stop_codon:yes gene_type:complete
MTYWPSYRQNNFRGINNKTDDFRIENEEASDGKNFLVDDEGTLKSRPGRAKRNGTAISGTPDVLSLFRYYHSDDSTVKLIASAGTDIWLGAETTPFNFTSLETSLTSNVKWRFVQFRDKVFGCNGTDSNWKYDGTNAIVMGVEVPNAPAVAIGASTGLTGDYYYKVSWQVDSYEEGDASVASSLIQPSNEDITVTKPTNTPEGDVTDWIIYRTKAGGSLYYKVASVAIGTGTYTDSTTDANLDTASEAPTDNNVPPVNADFIALHHRYVFLVDKDTSRIYFSKQDYPETYPAANYFDVMEKDGENLNGIISSQGGLWLFKKNNLYLLSGNDTTDFGIPTNSYTHYGCYAADSIKDCTLQGMNVILYLHKTGVRMWNGASSQLVSRKIQTTIDTIDLDYIDKAEAEVVGDEYWISFCTSGTSNNETWVLNLLDGGWRKYDFGCNALLEWKDGTLMSGQNSGWVYTEDTGTTDLSANISAEYYTKNYTFPHEAGNTNRYREFSLWASLATDDLSVNFVVDNDSTNKSFTKTLSAIGSTLVKKRFSLPQFLTGELIKIKFSWASQNACEVRAFEVRYMQIPRR